MLHINMARVHSTRTAVLLYNEQPTRSIILVYSQLHKKKKTACVSSLVR